MSTPLHILKLSVVGALAALALGYGGAVALDGIGMTSTRATQTVEPGATPIVRLTIEPSRPREGEFTLDQAPARSAAIESSPERALEPGFATGSLGQPRTEPSHLAPAAAAPVYTPPPAEAVESGSEPLSFGAGLSKASSLTPPGPEPEVATLTPPAAPIAPARPAQPSALQNVELLEPAPPAPPEVHDMPEESAKERVIDIGSDKPKSKPAADKKSAEPKESAKSKDEQATQKPKKTAKAAKRKKQDSFADGVSDTLSMFGF